MTLSELQAFLDEERKAAEQELGKDLCGSYRRCIYCRKEDEFACAIAHMRLEGVASTPAVQFIPDWYLPEPDFNAAKAKAAAFAPAPQPAPQPAPEPRKKKEGTRLLVLKRRPRESAE